MVARLVEDALRRTDVIDAAVANVRHGHATAVQCHECEGGAHLAQTAVVMLIEAVLHSVEGTAQHLVGEHH